MIFQKKKKELSPSPVIAHRRCKLYLTPERYVSLTDTLNKAKPFKDICDLIKIRG